MAPAEEDQMHVSLRARFSRVLAIVALALGTVVPAIPASAADGEELILRAGTDQDLAVLNPFNSVVVADFEVYTLNYDLLVNFGQNLEPVPGFAESWEPSADGLTWTFEIREGMQWSDGETADANDVVYTFQLILDGAASDLGYLGQGYVDGYLIDAGIESVRAIDDLTVEVKLSAPTGLILQTYVPILPEHVWSEYTLEEIGNFEGAEPFLNDQFPVVGTGPYQAVSWEQGESIRFERNPNDWRDEQGAADVVILQSFESGDTMVQALQTGDLDYVRGVLPDQFNALQGQENIVAVEGIANGYSELSFNTGGNGEGYGGSTAALADPAFRAALGYAVDTEALVEATLGGYGTPGTTIIPPYHARWHVPPEDFDNVEPRTFDLAEADRRLTEAGYVRRDGSGPRLDKEGNPITLRLTWPDSEAEHATNAEFISEWFGELGIEVDPAVTAEGALIEAVTGPPAGPADYDIYMWGWVGDPDPNSLLGFLTTDEIGGASDSYFSNERFDELYALQRSEPDPETRFDYLKEMQEIAYAEAPYIILYYDSELHAYRTDKFGGWENQPAEGGTPLFGYGSWGYTKLTAAGEEPSPEPSAGESPSPGASGPAQTPAASGSGNEQPAASGSNTMLLVLGIAALVAILAVGFVVMRRRGAAGEEE
jgi:peptide/nickel transport system substrate-binding protein